MLDTDPNGMRQGRGKQMNIVQAAYRVAGRIVRRLRINAALFKPLLVVGVVVVAWTMAPPAVTERIVNQRHALCKWANPEIRPLGSRPAPMSRIVANRVLRGLGGCPEPDLFSKPWSSSPWSRTQ